MTTPFESGDVRSIILNVLAALIFTGGGFVAAIIRLRWSTRRTRQSWKLLRQKARLGKAHLPIMCIVPVLEKETGRVGWYEMEAYGLLAQHARRAGAHLRLRRELKGMRWGEEPLLVLGGLPSSEVNRLIWTRLIETHALSFNIQERGVTLRPFESNREVLDIERGDDGYVVDYGYLYAVPNDRLSHGASAEEYTVGIMGVWGYGLCGAALAFADGTLIEQIRTQRFDIRRGFIALFRVVNLDYQIVDVRVLSLESLPRSPHGLRDVNGQPQPAVYLGPGENNEL